jgi:CubicO group peptidase (beta-lactamase class C family)
MIIPCHFVIAGVCSYISRTLYCSALSFFDNSNRIPIELLQGVINHPPRFPSYTTAVYSNLAYVLLGLAYQNITGNPLVEAHDDLFQNVLGMHSTSASYPGIQADAIIPRNDSWAVFSYNLGLYWPYVC